ncbi:unnamed protein product [Symbiodinium microadriaticum]|nr:unnamed protein product [Symbiodinium microadriaticum]
MSRRCSDLHDSSAVPPLNSTFPVDYEEAFAEATETVQVDEGPADALAEAYGRVFQWESAPPAVLLPETSLLRNQSLDERVLNLVNDVASTMHRVQLLEREVNDHRDFILEVHSSLLDVMDQELVPCAMLQREICLRHNSPLSDPIEECSDQEDREASQNSCPRSHVCPAQSHAGMPPSSASCPSCESQRKLLASLDWRVHRLETFRSLIQDDVNHLRTSLGLLVPFLTGDPQVAAAALESSVPSRLTRLEELVAHLSLQMQTLSTTGQASCNVTQADSQASGAELSTFALRLQRMEDFLSSLAASLAAMPPLDEL